MICIGELSLTGKVLPVGGIKEKVLAARRSGADTVILPTGCKGDYEELPQYVSKLCSVMSHLILIIPNVNQYKLFSNDFHSPTSTGEGLCNSALC